MGVASDLDDIFLHSTRRGFQSNSPVERACGSADGAESFANHAPAVVMALHTFMRVRNTHTA
ncbi:MAG: hypothetical protein OXE56_00965 [Gammaproteobacteria bacterium]|nr:hypothetical protein [Gammaproteobacteria bacterium]